MPSEQQTQQAVNAWYEGFLATPAQDGLLKVGSFNVLHSTGESEGSQDHDPATPPHAGRQVEDIAAVLKHGDLDILALQEARDSLDEVKAYFGAEWTFHGDTGENPQRQNPIMLRRGRWKDITDRHVFGGPETGPQPELWTTEVVATHRATGQRMKFLNSHLNSHVDNHGVPYDTPRQATYRLHMDNLATVVRHTRESVLVFAMADWNVDYDNARSRKIGWWPVQVLGEEGMTANWFYGRPLNKNTHDVRKIDYVFHRRTPQCKWANHRIVTGLDSDHNAVIVFYRVKALAGAEVRSSPSNTVPQPPVSTTVRPGAQIEQNRSRDYDLVLTANLVAGLSEDHEERLADFADTPGAAVILAQELVVAQTLPKWDTTQGTDPGSIPAGEAVLRRSDVVDGTEGTHVAGVAHTGLGYRSYPWADVVLPSLGEIVRVVCAHLPPAHLRALHGNEYQTNLYDLLDGCPYPFIVGGDFNQPVALDPDNLHGRYLARWFGLAETGFAVHPDLAGHVGGDGGRKWLSQVIPGRPDEQPVMMLRLTSMTHRQTGAQGDDDD